MGGNMTRKSGIYNIYVSHGLAGFLTLMCFATIYLSQSMLPTLEPDSAGYLQMDASRPVLYPLFLQIGAMLGDIISFTIILQTALYLISFYALILTLHRTFASVFVTLLAGMAVALNIYLQTFHTTILTESLSFTLMNGLIILLLRLVFFKTASRTNHIILLGVMTGLLMALKPALTSLLPAMVLIVAVFAYTQRQRFGRQTALILAVILGTLGADRLIYQSIHQERDSLSHYILFGKAAMLTTDPDFRIPQGLSSDETALLAKMQEQFAPYKKWLSSEKNRLVTSNIRANMEVYAQFQLYPYINKRKELTTEDKALMRRLGQVAITENPLAYVKLSLSYLAELWSVQALPFSLSTTDTKLPDFGNARLNSVLPHVAHTNSALDPTAKTTTNRFALIVFPAFAALGLTSFCLLFVFIYISSKKLFWHKQELTPTEMIVTSLLIIGWSNLIFIAFVNIPTPRYLMPHFPSFVLAALLTMQSLMTAFERRKSDKAQS